MRSKKMLPKAKDWFERFALKPDCISPTGREYFAWLLAEVDRLEATVKLLRAAGGFGRRGKQR